MKIFSPTISGSSQTSGSLTISGSLNVSQGITGSLFGTASWAINVVNGGGGSTNTGSLLTTASVNLNTITFTKGDSSQFNITVNTGSFTGSLQGTSSWANNSITASYALNGGVTQLLAGPNISLSPTTGVGQVTISSTGGGGGGFNTATGSYGSFYDTTTQTNPVADVPRSMSFNSTDITNGVSISGSTNPFNTYIKTVNAGIYNIQFSAQVEKTDSGTDEIVIWLRKNGIDLTDSATKLTLSGNGTKAVAAWNWFALSSANDYYQIIWVSADTGMRLYAEPINDTPGIPSVILTVNRVDQFLSNTGSFSGSFNGLFTGSLFGTASWAQSASNAINSQTASFLPIGTYNITASWAQSASNAINARTASFINNLNQNLSITGAVILSGSSLPELLVIGETQFTGSVSSLNGFTGSLLGTSSWATNALTASFASTASNISPAISNDSDTRITTANGNGTLNAESLLTFDGTKLSILYQSGEEGGEILLNKPVTNTSLTGSGITIDSYQNKIRFFEQGGAARGAYIDLTACTGGAGTNLLTGGGGATINNNVDNYLITATGTANTLNGESGLTFDGTTLTVANNAVITAIDVKDNPNTGIGEYAVGSHIARDWPAAGGPSITAGNIVYFSGSSQWANAQANATGSSTRVLGVVTNAADPNEILLQGTITINTKLSTYQVGQPVYLSPISGGRVTNIPPSSSGHVARYVGWVIDTSRDQIYFNPDFTYIQL